MPISFRTYNDPGVYIETITPPVVFTAAIEPTILAIVGEAPSTRDAFDSANLETGAWVSLTTRGGDPSTVNVTDKLLGTQYVNGGFGTLTTAISAGATGFAINLFDADWIEPAANFTALIEDEEVTIAVATGTVSAGVYTVTGVTRGVNSTVAAQHGIGQVINQTEGYADTESLEVGSLAAPISPTQTEFEVNELYGVQKVTLTTFDATDSFTLSYGGQTTSTIARGTTYTSAGITTALEALTTIDDVTVLNLAGTSTTIDDTGFTVKFFDPNTDVTALTINTVSGSWTSAISNRGVADDTYLDMDGERMLVTAVAGSTPQTVTVVRGTRGTTAADHGADVLYENSGADYFVKIGAGEDDDYGTSDDTLSLYILDRIANGAFVNVAFEATDEAQFAPDAFYDLDTIREKFGDPLDANGQIESELTLAAQLALANGATQLILVATDPADDFPVQDAIAKLGYRADVNTVVALSGNASDITYLKGHVVQQSNDGQLRRAFVGLDGLSDTLDFQDFIDKAGQLHSERVSLVAPSRLKLENGTDTPILVPGYFAAAAVAGLQAGQVPQEPLTRKQVFGFLGVDRDEQNSSQETFKMQAAGVLVISEDRFGRLIVKHGLTTDMTTVYTREISVITCRDRLRDFVLETLEGGALVGSPMTAETPNLVMAAVNSALEEAAIQGLIFDYSDVKYRFPTDNATMIQVRFSYKPTLPLNYIHVQFSIDTSTGTVEFQSINDNTST